MLCENCGCEMRIIKSFYRSQGDNSDSEQTRVFMVQKLKCTNKHCAHPSEQTIEHEISLTSD